MTLPHIVHLVDDHTAGGVMRMLDHLLHIPGLTSGVRQSVHKVSRSTVSMGPVQADVIVSHLTLSWRGLPALVTLRAMNPSTRIVHVEHSYTRSFTALNVPHKKRFFAMLRVAYSLFDHIVAVSRDQAGWLQDRNLVPNERLSVVHPEVDLSAFNGVAAPNPCVRVIGAFGRLERQKGFDLLIEAFRLCSHEDARLLIFGEGSERRHLEALAAGDARIEFRGHTTDLTRAYGEVDLVAMPSRWEAFGLVAQEAKAAGRSVIVAPVDGLNDQICDKVIAQASYDPASWAKVLTRFLEYGLVNLTPLRASDGAPTETYENKWMKVLTPGDAAGLEHASQLT